MLTRLIVDLYSWIIEISLWFVLAISGIVGYHYTAPVLHAAGWIPENEAAWKIFGGLVFAIATFLASAVLTGPFLVLVDIRKSVRALERNSGRSSSEILPAALREPFL